MIPSKKTVFMRARQCGKSNAMRIYTSYRMLEMMGKPIKPNLKLKLQSTTTLNKV